MKITIEILKEMGFQEIPYEGASLGIWELHKHSFTFIVTKGIGDGWHFGKSKIIKHVEEMLPLIAKDCYNDGYMDCKGRD